MTKLAADDAATGNANGRATANAPTSVMEPRAVPFADALRFWLKLGFISFGGPAGQIAIMHQELVDRRRWISERRFLHALNYCMLLPGPEAQQLATYLGWLMHRTAGGIVAGALFVLPSLLLLILLAWLYLAWGHHPLVAGVFYGIKPAVVAIVAQAAVRIGGRTLNNPALWTIALLAFVGLSVFAVPFPAIIAGAALLGAVGGRWRPAWFRTGGKHGAAAAETAALIDDTTPTPAHAKFTWPRLLQVLAIGGALWGLPMLLLNSFAAAAGLGVMGWFFTKAALLTFGGAYAVLPYVYQGAVVHHGWLTAAQMIDGLALGETTPGPLIMIVAFVGFVGGWNGAAAGTFAGTFAGADPLLGGVVAACVATWFTFLPSFVFILAGAPLVESTHQDLRVTAPLTAITAAVVGVVGNLALFFAGHVFWPAGWQAAARGALAWTGGVDAFAVGLTALAAVALLRYRRGVTEVIAVCGVAGLLAHPLGLAG